MYLRVDESLRGTPLEHEARELLGRCVHCGFCTAACPTYRLLGDELDGPRGRIYLIKRALEDGTPGERTQLHLDRCLTCRACEPACPSGVQYGRLLDLGRQLVAQRVPRPAGTRLVRALLRATLTRPRLFAGLLRIARALRPVLPARWRARVPARREAGPVPARAQPRRVLLLAGCVQPGLAPGIEAATRRVLDALGIECCVPPAAGCCGAIRQHLDDARGALDEARRNVDAWWPMVEAGAEALVINASGCGVMVRDYGHLLRDDPAYAARAARIAALACDLAELVQRELPRLAALAARTPVPARIAFHPPCTLQHGLRIVGVVEAILAALGAQLRPFPDSGLCCGSAGTYSLLQAPIAERLRQAKLAALEGSGAELVLSANIGCIEHLAGAASLPVRHWIEWVDERIAGGRS